MNESFSTFMKDFGIDVTINGSSVRGIFDNGFAAIFGMDSSTPSLTVAAADIPDVVQGNTVVIAAVRYTITDVQPDGTGITKLMLQKA
jgi:hypothetical protein